jgi:hypothetical protein
MVVMDLRPADDDEVKRLFSAPRNRLKLAFVHDPTRMIAASPNPKIT